MAWGQRKGKEKHYSVYRREGERSRRKREGEREGESIRGQMGLAVSHVACPSSLSCKVEPIPPLLEIWKTAC